MGRPFFTSLQKFAKKIKEKPCPEDEFSDSLIELPTTMPLAFWCDKKLISSSTIICDLL